jgi:DNA-binding GntR family transcriptional regulator
MDGHDQRTGSAVETVYRRLRTAIVTGELRPEAPLRLSALARSSQVSVSPVREALRLLQAEGFVVAIPGTGARVAPMSVADLHDVYGLRQLVEAESARLAATRHSALQLSRLRRLVERAAGDPQGDVQGALAHDRTFHLAVAGVGGSAHLPRLVALFWDLTARYRYAIGTANHGGETADHDTVLVAVATGDGRAAVEAVCNHLAAELAAVEPAYLRLVPPGAPAGGRLLRLPGADRG